MSKIKVIICKVREAPTVTEIESGLDSMQGVVGGLIEVVRLSHNVDLWINEEGRFTKEPNRLVTDERGNRWDIFGDFFLASHDQEGETTSPTNESAETWLARIKDAPQPLTFGM